MAAANGYVEVALYILSKSCKVDIQDIDGWTPLHAAAFWGEVDIIELLGAHGADFKIRTFSGERPTGTHFSDLPITFISKKFIQILVVVQSYAVACSSNIMTDSAKPYDYN